MERLLRSPLRGFRWLFLAVAVLVALAFALGSSTQPSSTDPLFLAIPVALVLAFGYLGLGAGDPLLSRLVAFCRHYGPWLVIASGAIAVLGLLA
jgi:hypothetical protein